MKANIVQYVDEQCIKHHPTVIVIDVFRATTTMVTALENGAREIVSCINAEEALGWSKKYNFKNDRVILAGEVDMKKHPEFDRGNSPVEFQDKENIFDKTIVLSTTNGTRAIRHARHAKKIYACCFLNCYAVAKQICKENNDFTIICAGSKGNFAIEDAMCAAMLIHQVSLLSFVELDDFSRSMSLLYAKNNKNIDEIIRTGRSYNKLINNGFCDDVEFCLQKNIYELIVTSSHDGVVRSL